MSAGANPGAPPLVWVTGASRGIGREAARALARRGARLLLFGRDADALESSALACRELGAPETRIVRVDLRDADALAAVASDALRAATPDVAILNAGVVRRAPIEEMTLEAFREQISVNLEAPFVLTRAVLPAMRARGSGRILFLGSIASVIGSRRHSAYAASKWALVGFMKSLAEEIGDSGLMTAALLPGSVATDMLEGSGFPPRMSAEDVAKSLVFLALDAPLAHNGAVVEMFGV